MAILFTSDTHWDHARVIQWAKRPWASLEEMNEGLIARWNEKVDKNDEVYHLGDFCFGNRVKRIPEILSRLNGKAIHLIKGNHDHTDDLKKVGHLFASVEKDKDLKINGEHIVLHHYPKRSWNKSHHGAYHLFGHEHGNMPAFGRSLDVGVDVWDWYPVTFDEVKQRLTELGLIDQYGIHHGRSGAPV